MHNKVLSIPDLRSCDEVILYGAGNAGARLLRVLQSCGIRVRQFLDRSATGAVGGVAVRHPEKTERINVPVLISVFNPNASTTEIRAYLATLGYNTVVPFVDVHAQFIAEWGDDYWLTDRTFVTAHRDEINRAQSLLEDATSRALFSGVVKFRETGDFEAEPQPDLKRQYFPSDIPEWPGNEPLRFVDCGAYVGDTLTRIRAMNIPMDSVAAFEPDPENFAKLAELARKKLEPANIRADLWPCGVAERNKIVSFEAGLGAASRFGGSGSAVQCVALDDTVFAMRPSMIKMDVEGAEVEALHGARRIIEKFRPMLAVSAYHRPAHLWEILFLISSWNLGYKFYVRSHGFQTFDTLVYATPSAPSSLR